MKRITFDAHCITEEIYRFIELKDDKLNGIPAFYEDPDNYEHGNAEAVSLGVMLDSSGYKDDMYVANLKRFVEKTFAEELVYAVLSERFHSLPETVSNRFFKLAEGWVNYCYDTDPQNWMSICKAAGRMDNTSSKLSNSRGLRTSQLRRFYNELFANIHALLDRSLPANLWLTVGVTLTERVLTIDFGEDLRHVVFEMAHGKGRWEGQYIEPWANRS